MATAPSYKINPNKLSTKLREAYLANRPKRLIFQKQKLVDIQFLTDVPPTFASEKITRENIDDFKVGPLELDVEYAIRALKRGEIGIVIIQELDDNGKILTERACHTGYSFKYGNQEKIKKSNKTVNQAITILYGNEIIIGSNQSGHLYADSLQENVHQTNIPVDNKNNPGLTRVQYAIVNLSQKNYLRLLA